MEDEEFDPGVDNINLVFFKEALRLMIENGIKTYMGYDIKTLLTVSAPDEGG